MADVKQALADEHLPVAAELLRLGEAVFVDLSDELADHRGVGRDRDVAVGRVARGRVREQLEVDALLECGLAIGAARGLASNAGAVDRRAVDRRDDDVARSRLRHERRRWTATRLLGRRVRAARRDCNEERTAHVQSRCTKASRAISLPTEITATPITITSNAAT